MNSEGGINAIFSPIQFLLQTLSGHLRYSEFENWKVEIKNYFLDFFPIVVNMATSSSASIMRLSTNSCLIQSHSRMISSQYKVSSASCSTTSKHHSLYSRPSSRLTPPSEFRLPNSKNARFFPLAEHLAPHAGHFPHGSIGPTAVHQVGHDVFTGAGSPFELLQRPAHFAVIPCAA